MSGPIPVFVNDRPVPVPPGATAAEAVAAFDAELAERIGIGSAYLTDGRGIPLDPNVPLFPGAIVRVIVSARRAETSEPDAHP